MKLKKNSKDDVKKVFSPIFSFSKFLFILILCAVSSFVLVFPFWIFAEKAPKAYSVTILVLVLAVLVYIICVSIVKKLHGKSESEKKDFRHNFWRGFAIFLLVIFGLVIPIILVLSYKRLIALFVFVAFFLAVGVFSSCVKKK